MKKNVFLIVIAGLGILCATNCTNPDKSSKSDAGLLDIEVDKTSPNAFESSFSAPSPEELLMLFEGSGLVFNSHAVNSPNNINKYISSKSLSYNLGVYVTDAAYLNMFEQYGLMSSYLENIFNITDQLELSGIYNEFNFKKVFVEMDKPDSLIALSEGVYHAITNYMTETNNEQMLCLIYYGSIIEMLHLAIESIEEFKADDPVLQHLADQKMQLDNLTEFASQYDDNADVVEMLTRLEKLKAVWSTLEQTKKESRVAKGEEGKLIIGGGLKYSFTQEQFNELKRTVEEIRNEITA